MDEIQALLQAIEKEACRCRAWKPGTCTIHKQMHDLRGLLQKWVYKEALGRPVAR